MPDGPHGDGRSSLLENARERRVEATGESRTRCEAPPEGQPGCARSPLAPLSNDPPPCYATDSHALAYDPITPLGGCCMTPGFVRVRVARLAFFGAIVAVAACGDSGSTDPSRPQAVTRISPDSQSAVAGVKMDQPLVVKVTGGGGTALGGISVEWTIGAGGGTVSDSVTTTNAEGLAQTTYTPGTAIALAKVTATVGSLPGVPFTVSLVAGAATALQKFGFSSPATVAGSTLPLSVKLVDTYGNPIAGGTVNWTNAGGTISATTSTTDSGGIATVSYTVGSDPGTYSLTATVEGIPPATFTVKAI